MMCYTNKKLRYRRGTTSAAHYTGG